VQAEVRLSVDVAADPETVWDRAVDWTGQREWIPLTYVRHVEGAPLEVGTRVVARTGIGPVGFDDTMTVTSVVSPESGPRSVEVLHTGRVVRGVGEMRVEPHDGGTRFWWWERVDVPGGPVAPAVWLVAGPAVRLLFGHALRRFARWVETDAGSPAPRR